MHFPKVLLLLLFLGLITLIGFTTGLIKLNLTQSNITQPLPTITPENKTKYPQDYTFVLIGDSMTAALGNSDELRKYLTEYYPDKSFEFLNYGFGSTNILSVEKRLTQNTDYGRVFQPILNIDFDIILIESFGYNPLSQFPLEEGILKNNEALDKIISLIKASNPKAPIVFVATIAPNSKKYGLGEVDLSPEKRAQWAAERTTYIKNHITYAKNHQIPLINIYERSLKNGDGNLDLFNSENYIHPSPTGVHFISKEIADYLAQSKILENIKKP